jgi:hypothetical protein
MVMGGFKINKSLATFVKSAVSSRKAGNRVRLTRTAVQFLRSCTDIGSDGMGPHRAAKRLNSAEE